LVSSGEARYVAFRPVADPLELAIAAAESAQDARERSKASQSPGTGSAKTSDNSISAQITSAKLNVDNKANLLAILVVFGEVMKEILALMTKPQNLALGISMGNTSLAESISAGVALGNGFPSTPKQIPMAVRIFRQQIDSAFSTIKKKYDSQPVLISFDNDPSSPRKISVDMRNIIITDKLLVRRGAGFLYIQGEDKGKFISDYESYENSDTVFTKQDVRRANYIFQQIVSTILPGFIEPNSSSSLSSNEVMQRAIDVLNTLQTRKLTTVTSMTSSSPLDAVQNVPAIIPNTNNPKASPNRVGISQGPL
jgi:hypothetical protein